MLFGVQAARRRPASLLRVEDDQRDAGHAGDQAKHDEHGQRPDLHLLLAVRVLEVVLALGRLPVGQVALVLGAERVQKLASTESARCIQFGWEGGSILDNLLMMEATAKVIFLVFFCEIYNSLLSAPELAGLHIDEEAADASVILPFACGVSRKLHCQHFFVANYFDDIDYVFCNFRILTHPTSRAPDSDSERRHTRASRTARR